MNRDKKGFTLAEVLVCITIIGVIMALSVNSIKIVKSSYTALTYFTFKNLKDMVGTIYSGKNVYTNAVGIKINEDGTTEKVSLNECKQSGVNCKKETLWVNGKAEGTQDAIIVDSIGYERISDHNGSRLPSAVSACRKSNNMIENVLKNDHEFERQDYENCSTSGVGCTIPLCSSRTTSNPADTPIFCSSLAAVANVQGVPKCAYSDLKSITMFGNEPLIEDLDPNEPNFMTTNGQRYYISKWEKNNKVSDIYGFRVVAVDLNGKRGPNLNSGITRKTEPDIVSFIVLDNGEVLPLSHAADNIQKGDRQVTYINAKVKGYYYSTTDASGNLFDVRTRENVPQECVKMGTCNFAVVPVKTTKEDPKDEYFMSYREAYCMSHDSNNPDVVAYKNYCTDSIPKNPLCPPTIHFVNAEGYSRTEKSFDKCMVETVRPAFRYNLK